MSLIFLRQAQLILAQVDLNEPDVIKAKELLSSFEKSASISDLIRDPRLSNAINLLTPFVVNYKVNQVLKLLKEMSKDSPKIDPQTGLKRFI
jgi:hypothetical protein